MKLLIVGLALLTVTGCGGQRGPLMAHGKPIDAWVQSLHDPDAKARKRAAEVLGNVGAADASVLPALAAAVKDRDRAVREAAVVALLKIGPAARDAAPALSEASNDADAKVRTYAVKALENIRRAP